MTGAETGLPLMSAYPAQQSQGNYALGMEHHWWTRSRANTTRRALGGSRAGTVLDVGCGPGIAVQHLREAGYECVGCEWGVLSDDEPIAVDLVTPGLLPVGGYLLWMHLGHPRPLPPGLPLMHSGSFFDLFSVSTVKLVQHGAVPA